MPENLAQEQAARAEAEAALRKFAFLAEAGKVLASSLDYQVTLDQVARLCVPRLADWCIVDLVEDNGVIRQVTVAHAEPMKVQLAWELDRRYPDNPAAPEGVPKVIRTGRSELFPEISDELIRAVARNEEHLRIIRQLGLRSGMIVPLPARGRVLGALSLGIAESARRYQQEDLALAEELARCAALAVDNARLYREVQEADRRKDFFLAVLAHELRGPLSPILNGIYVARQPGTEPKKRDQALDMVSRQAQHLTDLVNGLLEASRVVRGKVQIRNDRLDLGKLVRTTVEDRRFLLDEAGLLLVVTTPEAPVWITGDATRLAQVLTNLLENAVKFCNRGGHVDVSLRGDPSRQQAILIVADNGIGIEPAALSHLFEPFAQADRSLDRPRGGLGLGLAVVRRLMEMHQGTVEAASPGPGHGATFTLKFPLAAEPPALAPGPTPAATGGERLRVLIIEDNEDAAVSLKLLLEMLGHEVRTKSTGVDGLKEALAWRPDAVISDIGLPGRLDGYAVGRALRENSSTAGSLLIALTGYGSEEDRRQTLQAGFDYHLTKAAEPEMLQKLLSNGRARNHA
jgi:signal transduction histidine kinase/CheY-like chemotaxis protein